MEGFVEAMEALKEVYFIDDGTEDGQELNGDYYGEDARFTYAILFENSYGSKVQKIFSDSATSFYTAMSEGILADQLKPVAIYIQTGKLTPDYVLPYVIGYKHGTGREIKIERRDPWRNPHLEKGGE